MGKDRRAREILGELVERRSLGDRLLERVGRRGWERPNVAVSERLFARFNIADPWDPLRADKKETPIGLGPVSLRLGPDRRQPAPHLRPRQPKSQKSSPRLPNVPSASASASGGSKLPPGFKPPVGVPKAKTSQYRPPTPPPRPKTELSREFGGGSQPHKLVGALPVRPELAAKLEATTAKKSGKEPAASRPALPRPVRPVPRPATRSRKPTVMARNPNLPAPEGEDGVIDRRPPMPARPERRRRGRLAMQSTQATTSPVVTEIPERTAEVVAPTSEPVVAPKRVAAPVMAGGLDDLFGFAAQEGRMRFGKKKKTPKGE
jgi:hypothetical protein